MSTSSSKLSLAIHHPLSKIASAVLLSGGLISARDLLLQINEPPVQAATYSAQQNFINLMAQYAKPVADSHGLFPSVMIAQAILESNWGNSQLASAPYYNLFGIKGSYKGQSVIFPTQEFQNQRWLTINAAFRSYPSYSESFADNAQVLKNTNFGAGPYYQGAWRAYASSYQQATAALQGKYASAPNYAAALNNLIAQYNLDRYDGANISPHRPTDTAASHYLVQSGDSLWAIGQRFGVSIPQLQNWNHLSSYLIFPGQSLLISPPAQSKAPSRQSPAPAQSQSITVLSGDSLWAIAQKHHTTVNQLKAWNHLSSDLIFPGQKLLVSASSAPVSKPAQPHSPAAAKTSFTSITVRAGDCLWALANRYRVSIAQIKSWNHLPNNLILVGQKLLIGPGHLASPAPHSAPTPTHQENIHKVKAGDTLWALAQQHGVSIQQIKTWNHLSSDLILVGQYLRVG